MAQQGLIGGAVNPRGTGPQSPVGKLLAAAMMVLKQPQIMDAILNAANAEDQEDELGSLAVSIINGLDDKAMGKIPPDAMARFTIELMEALAALANAVRDEDDPDLGRRTMGNVLEKSAQLGASALEQARGQGGGEAEHPQEPPEPPEEHAAEGAEQEQQEGY